MLTISGRASLLFADAHALLCERGLPTCGLNELLQSPADADIHGELLVVLIGWLHQASALQRPDLAAAAEELVQTLLRARGITGPVTITRHLDGVKIRVDDRADNWVIVDGASLNRYCRDEAPAVIQAALAAHEKAGSSSRACTVPSTASPHIRFNSTRRRWRELTRAPKARTTEEAAPC